MFWRFLFDPARNSQVGGPNAIDSGTRSSSLEARRHAHPESLEKDASMDDDGESPRAALHSALRPTLVQFAARPAYALEKTEGLALFASAFCEPL
jgi:hypothetical protein